MQDTIAMNDLPGPLLKALQAGAGNVEYVVVARTFNLPAGEIYHVADLYLPETDRNVPGQSVRDLVVLGLLEWEPGIAFQQGMGRITNDGHRLLISLR